MPLPIGEIFSIAADDVGRSAAQIVFVRDLAVDELQGHPILFAFDLSSIGTQIKEETILGSGPKDEERQYKSYSCRINVAYFIIIPEFSAQETVICTKTRAKITATAT